MEEDIKAEDNIYQVTFEIEYRADFGQTIFVMGDIGELGHWKKLLFELKWHEGDIWRASTEVSTRVFLYKYVLVDNSTDTIVKWEEGYNRIADLEIAYKQGLCTDDEYIFCDKWERFELVLKLMHPFLDEHSRILRVGETIEGYGTWNDGKKPTKMQRIKNERLYHDGEEVSAYQAHICVRQPKIYQKVIEYMYSIYYPDDDVVVWEREPSRKIIIEDPEDYARKAIRGNLAKSK